jgi:hypothetical protein
MNDMLQEAIAGTPVTVTIGRETYPLAFPIQGVILYKRETARLDRERTKDRPKLMREEKRALREARQKLLADANLLRPKERGEPWDPEHFRDFELAMEEATALKIEIDEDTAAGDSLYDMYNWRKISPSADPERLLLALWVGLHHFVPADKNIAGAPLVYTPRLSRAELGVKVDLSNGEDLTLAVSKALTAHLIVAETEARSTSPNELAPATSPAETETEMEVELTAKK